MRKRKPVLLNGEALMADGKPLEFDAVDQDELDGKIDAPQTAQVGEVLTVEEVDEDGKPTKWKAAKVSGTFVCTFNDGEDGWITCDKTVEEIITANNNGEDVIGHYYGEIYRLSTPLETGGGYGNPMFSNLGVGVLSIIQYDGGHFGINRIRLSDIAPEDIPNSYEVPVYVPTRDGMQWQYGRPLLATDYAMNELTDEEKALMQKNLGIDDLSLVKYTEQELTIDEQTQARENIRAQQTDFIINVEENEDGVATADKTLVEIKTAYESKVNMWAVFYGNRYTFQGYLRITDSYLFVCVMDNVVTKYGSISMIEFNSNGNISIHGMEFTALSKMEQIIVGNGGAISGVPLGQNPVPENATYVTVPKASGLKAGKVLTTTGKNGVLAMEWKDINFPVTITPSTTDGVTTYTADKTFAEIKAAYDSGANVCVNLYGNLLFLSEISEDHVGFGGIITDYCNVVIINSENIITASDYYLYALKYFNDIIIDDDGNLFVTKDYSFTTMTVPVPNLDVKDGAALKCMASGLEWVEDTSLPAPTTAQVGQIVKVKSVDESGKITETETVDMPTQKTLKWVTVHSSDLTETKRELIISTDTDGKSIADYNPVGLSLIVSTPADATVESNNGSPWVYPSATKADNAIRVIGNISGWKTVARDSAFVFNGGSSAMSCSGNVNTSLATYKLDGYALDGVKIFFNSANDHLPVGTHVEVSILCEVAE